MGKMKKIYLEMMRQREDKDMIEFKTDFKYHLLKDPGGLSQHVLIDTVNDELACSGTMSAIQKYLEYKKIPQFKVFNYYKYWDK